MNVKLILAGFAVIGMLAGCGDDDDNNATPPVSNQSTRQWQNIQVTAECIEATDPGEVCNEGAAALMFNWDGSFSFNNGQRTGNLSVDDLNRLVAATDTIVSQDAVQQQSCADSSTDILLAHQIAIALTATPGTPIVVYEERDNSDEVCARGDVDRLQDLRELLAELAVKYAPTTSPSPTPSPTPTATPMPTPTATPMT